MPEEPTTYKLEHKEDVWRIPPETRVLMVECKLNLHAAQVIVEQCRELEKVSFSGQAYALTDKKTVEYLNQWAFVGTRGIIKSHGIDEKTADKIRELYARGDNTLDSLAQNFCLPKNIIWHIVHEKAPKPGTGRKDINTSE